MKVVLEDFLSKYGTTDFIYSCFTLSMFTACALVFFEWLCWDKKWTERLTRTPTLRKMYLQAVWTNLFHYSVIGPLSYAFAIITCLELGDSYPDHISIPGVLMTQAVGYALAHSFMHIPSNYWMHKFHHSYNEKTFVRPIAANSTTVAEFLVAYAILIVTGIIVFRPRVEVVFYIVASISFTNLCIHTPMSFLNMKWAPDWVVTNDKHFSHHEKDLRMHYSAPIFDLDYILGIGMKRFANKESTVKNASVAPDASSATEIQKESSPAARTSRRTRAK